MSVGLAFCSPRNSYIWHSLNASSKFHSHLNRKNNNIFRILRFSLLRIVFSWTEVFPVSGAGRGRSWGRWCTQGWSPTNPTLVQGLFYVRGLNRRTLNKFYGENVQYIYWFVNYIKIKLIKLIKSRTKIVFLCKIMLDDTYITLYLSSYSFHLTYLYAY